MSMKYTECEEPTIEKKETPPLKDSFTRCDFVSRNLEKVIKKILSLNSSENIIIKRNSFDGVPTFEFAGTVVSGEYNEGINDFIIQIYTNEECNKFYCEIRNISKNRDSWHYGGFNQIKKVLGLPINEHLKKTIDHDNHERRFKDIYPLIKYATENDYFGENEALNSLIKLLDKKTVDHFNKTVPTKSVYCEKNSDKIHIVNKKQSFVGYIFDYIALCITNHVEIKGKSVEVDANDLHFYKCLIFAKKYLKYATCEKKYRKLFTTTSYTCHHPNLKHFIERELATIQEFI